MKFCSSCGQSVEFLIPSGDTYHRYVCSACGVVHYQNPNNVVGCIPEASDGRILLCKRAIEPRKGYWTIPAGFMENKETLAEGAKRETREEAEAEVKLLGLQSIIDVPFASQVHIMFRGELIDDKFGNGIESLETHLVAEDNIPWDEIAFPTVAFALKTFFADRARGEYTVHDAVIQRNRWDVKQPLPF
ncbi:MAG: NUDIX hydrolase [Gammaproteobacteria bacterium]|nr:NUDIX hydrolase [Gammaproteobacteria bacterium]NNC96687.1 NUDIX hydrolase [Gammaproteobacteria bacterium]NNM13809.1 NUDIX hydrolase [Gammaproteobacteria bacterium]